MALTTNVELRISSAETGATLDFGTAKINLEGGHWVDQSQDAPLDEGRVFRYSEVPHTYLVQMLIPSGTDEGYSDMRWSDQRTLGSSATDTLDLYGSLVGNFANTLNFVRMTGLVLSSVTGPFTLSRPTNGVEIFSAVGDAITVPDGGMFIWIGPRTPGVDVVAGTGDLLAITAGAAGCTYDIHIIGTSA